MDSRTRAGASTSLHRAAYTGQLETLRLLYVVAQSRPTLSTHSLFPSHTAVGEFLFSDVRFCEILPVAQPAPRV